MRPPLQLPDALSIDAPIVSPGSTKTEQRPLAQVHFRETIRGTLTVDTIIRWLQRTVEPFWPVAGHAGTSHPSGGGVRPGPALKTR